jgi:hypothetical protein
MQELEQFLQGRRGPSGSTAANAAYGKGKEIGLSLVKRLRRKLLTSSGPSVQHAVPPPAHGGAPAARGITVASLRGGAALQVLLAALLPVH